MNETVGFSKAQLFLQQIKRQEVPFGGHVFLQDPMITEIMALTGYTYIWIDGEHSSYTAEKIYAHILAAHAGGALSFVRVPWNDPVRLKPILELNPDGIIVPMINSRKDAERAVEACTYPPKGIRGLGPRRSNQYNNMDFSDYLENTRKTFLLALQIEHADAVEHCDEILEVEGFDLVILGPLDMSASLGCPGKIGGDKVKSACLSVLEKCKKAGIPCGISLGFNDLTLVKWWLDNGIDFLSSGDDLGFIQSESARVLENLSNFKKGK